MQHVTHQGGGKGELADVFPTHPSSSVFCIPWIEGETTDVNCSSHLALFPKDPKSFHFKPKEKFNFFFLPSLINPLSLREYECAIYSFTFSKNAGIYWFLPDFKHQKNKKSLIFELSNSFYFYPPIVFT